MPRLAMVGAVVLAVGLGACGSGSSKKTSSTTAAPSSTSSSSTTTPASTTATTTRCPTGTGMGPFTTPSPATALLTDVVVHTDTQCADKVTFTFQGGVAGYDVSYKPGPFHDAGSGALHPVTGSAFVVVRFHPAWIADFSGPSAPLTYHGPKSIHPAGTVHVKDLELVDAFEGYVTWVIGVDSQHPLTVTSIASLPAVVVAVG